MTLVGDWDKAGIFLHKEQQLPERGTHELFRVNAQSGGKSLKEIRSTSFTTFSIDEDGRGWMSADDDDSSTKIVCIIHQFYWEGLSSHLKTPSSKNLARLSKRAKLLLC